MGFWQQFLTNIFTTTVLVAGIFFMIKKWIEHRIAQSIKHEYDKKLEQLKNEISARNRAVLVAELISEWIDCPKERVKLNRLTFEAFLWLPENVARELSKALAHDPSAKDIRAILLMVRHHLLGEDGLEAPEIIVFTKTPEFS